MTDIDGKEVRMGDFRDKKILVVNVASECGNTPQYEILEKLYKKYGSEKFVIIGFPANNFGKQEPGVTASNPGIRMVNYCCIFTILYSIINSRF